MDGPEDHAVQTLLSWLLHEPTPAGVVAGEPQARAAARLLAERSRALLGWGLAGADIERLWPRRPLSLVAARLSAGGGRGVPERERSASGRGRK